MLHRIYFGIDCAVIVILSKVVDNDLTIFSQSESLQVIYIQQVQREH